MSLNRLDLIGDYSRCARLLKKKIGRKQSENLLI